jgi:hypothetical protein
MLYEHQIHPHAHTSHTNQSITTHPQPNPTPLHLSIPFPSNHPSFKSTKQHRQVYRPMHTTLGFLGSDERDLDARKLGEKWGGTRERGRGGRGGVCCVWGVSGGVDLKGGGGKHNQHRTPPRNTTPIRLTQRSCPQHRQRASAGVLPTAHHHPPRPPRPLPPPPKHAGAPPPFQSSQAHSEQPSRQ